MRDDEDATEEEGEDEEMVNGKLTKTGKIATDKKDKKPQAKDTLRGGPGEGGVESYSGAGHEGSSPKDQKFVRWSSSTEIGDFIRDAARGAEFIVEIESSANEIRVGVPSFRDRTHYLRIRLRKAARKLDSMASVKEECDKLAHRSAQRLALGGFGVLLSWWMGTYYFTFLTDYG